jgi:hypothetical protein
VLQVTSTGQEPGVAVDSTVQDQETAPPPSASFGASPSALLRPVGSATAIVQNAFGSVVTVARAVWPRTTGVLTTSVMSSAPMTLSILIGGGATLADAAAGVAVGVEVRSAGGGVVAEREAVLAQASATSTIATITAHRRRALILRLSCVGPGFRERM